MIRTSIFQATGVNGWSQSLPFVGNAISTQLGKSYAIDGLITWEPIPSATVDRIRWSERQRSTQLIPLTTERSWLLAKSSVPVHCVGVIERIATLVEIEALDEDGVPITSWRLDGQTIFRGFLSHPDPVQGDLEVRWHLRQDSINYWSPINNINGIDASVLPGEDLIEPWDDDLYGWNARHWDQQQLIVPDGSRQTLWLSVRADSQRWLIRAKGRIGGYYQQRSGRDSAGDSARKRS